MSQTRAQKKHRKQLKRDRKAKNIRIQKQKQRENPQKLSKFEKIIAELQAQALKAKYDLNNAAASESLKLDLSDD